MFPSFCYKTAPNEEKPKSDNECETNDNFLNKKVFPERKRRVEIQTFLSFNFCLLCLSHLKEIGYVTGFLWILTSSFVLVISKEMGDVSGFLCLLTSSFVLGKWVSSLASFAYWLAPLSQLYEWNRWHHWLHLNTDWLLYYKCLNEISDGTSCFINIGLHFHLVFWTKHVMSLASFESLLPKLNRWYHWLPLNTDWLLCHRYLKEKDDVSGFLWILIASFIIDIWMK